jgi:hypothetical protein
MRRSNWERLPWRSRQATPGEELNTGHSQGPQLSSPWAVSRHKGFRAASGEMTAGRNLPAPQGRLATGSLEAVHDATQERIDG